MMRLGKSLSALALTTAFAGVAYADLPLQVRITDGAGMGIAGSYNVTITQGALQNIGGVGSTFKSFCLEYDEYLTFWNPFSGGDVYYGEVAESAMYGGAGGPTPDPLDPRTAAVYKQWLSGNTSDEVLATKYQLAIWRLEEEVYYGRDLLGNGPDRWRRTDTGAVIHAAYQNSSFTEAAITELINSVGAPTSLQDVRVLRLWASPDYHNLSTTRQDILVYGQGFTPVPAPGAAILGLIGMGSVSWMKRRLGRA